MRHQFKDPQNYRDVDEEDDNGTKSPSNDKDKEED